MESSGMLLLVLPLISAVLLAARLFWERSPERACLVWHRITLAALPDGFLLAIYPGWGQRLGVHRIVSHSVEAL